MYIYVNISAKSRYDVLPLRGRGLNAIHVWTVLISIIVTASGNDIGFVSSILIGNFIRHILRILINSRSQQQLTPSLLVASSLRLLKIGINGSGTAKATVALSHKHLSTSKSARTWI